MPSKPLHTLFISDLHLQAERPELTEAFLAFVQERAAQAEALYILGDFFNQWLGDDDHAPLHDQVSSALHALSAQGTQVYLIHGNRDFMLGPDFARACGAQLITSPYPQTLYGQNYLLMHGDSLCTDDLDYQRFRSMVRDPAWQAGMLARPLAERRAFAAQARQQSKAMSSNKAADIMDVNAEAVNQRLREFGCKRLIHGHTHRPAVHDWSLDGSPARRIVLGDWDQQGWFLRLDEHQESLEHFDINSPP